MGSWSGTAQLISAYTLDYLLGALRSWDREFRRCVFDEEPQTRLEHDRLVATTLDEGLLTVIPLNILLAVGEGFLAPGGCA